MADADRAMAERIHAIVTEVAPELEPKTWYGQPAYAKDGKVVVFFQAASKFNTRYATLGFNDVANHRRRLHVADGLRAHGAHGRGREADRRAREEGGQLTVAMAAVYR